MSKLAEVIEKVKENRVKFVRLQFTDVFGHFKNIAITVENLEEIYRKQKMFDSSAVSGFVDSREHDIMLVPDPSTFVVFPWRPREGAVGRFICDVFNPDGTPYKYCSRNILKKMSNILKELGYTLHVGSEIEFFLFNLSDKGEPTVSPHDKARYCDLTPVDLGENARRDMVLTLESMGIEIGASHHENSPGQHEIILKVGNALETADKIITFKYVVRTIAQRHGLHASFLPKPLKKVNGSALHLTHKLLKDEHNCFYDRNNNWGLSREALKFMYGIIKHAPAISAITNPLVNSYKRLAPSYVAPFYLGWSKNNRNTIIRVPESEKDNTRIEVRFPDPSCNPYLALASFLTAGIDGLNGKNNIILKPEENIDYQNYVDDVMLYFEENIMPRNLNEAIIKLKSNKIIQNALGDELTDTYIRAKRKEWERFHQEIHQWELDEYLAYI